MKIQQQRLSTVTGDILAANNLKFVVPCTVLVNMGSGGSKLKVKTVLWPDEVLGLVVGPGGGRHRAGAAVHGQGLSGAGHP